MTTKPLGAAKVMGFVPTRDFSLARAFYAGKLKLKLVAKDKFALVFESGGITIRVVKVANFKPFDFTLLGSRVREVRKTVMSLQKRGIVFERYPFLEQDALGIWTAPGGAQVAWFKDPDGNVLSIST